MNPYCHVIAQQQGFSKLSLVDLMYLAGESKRRPAAWGPEDHRLILGPPTRLGWIQKPGPPLAHHWSTAHQPARCTRQTLVKVRLILWADETPRRLRLFHGHDVHS
ncbi:hypothetical protein BCR37DRAFT_253788 [Protomyces lactucae-debilis]|uniref:Uncharacterized protein n=1 Tax=Protomyces lactucae-debilis TaxID=2754530 RepID=A0A1Y2FLN1_PROLT|nr:uncharacterized protein BCR37DRAFT_253788 [Protomyces lactucae-debilis]ORY84873.1 hypothetical protein BCR37DRAFT_253788 [Protomyces lactucae-debilis]